MRLTGSFHTMRDPGAVRLGDDLGLRPLELHRRDSHGRHRRTALAPSSALSAGYPRGCVRAAAERPPARPVAARARAAGPHPRVGHRRRPGDARARTARAASPTPTTPPPAGRWASSRTSSATRCCPATPTPTPRASGTGLQTTRLREDARRDHPRRRRRRRRRGRHLLRLRVDRRRSTSWSASSTCGCPADLDRRYGFSAQIPAAERPVVFIGPYEHHSNELPWRESIADVVTIPEDADGHIDAEPPRGGAGRATPTGRSRSGRSPPRRNVTGHRDRHRTRSRRCCTSTARCRSGTTPRRRRTSTSTWPATPRYPAATRTRCSSRRTSSSAVPARPASWSYAASCSPTRCPWSSAAARSPTSTRSSTSTSSDPVHREEGGTPAIVESIRAGLVFDLKRAVGTDVIRAHEDDFVRRAHHRWAEHPTIEVLGNREAERLSIVSFTVRRPGGRYLHHNFVVALLNDLFGIQSRGGCSCAGPYGHRLLGIDLERSARVRARDRPRLRGDQARLGAGELQLLHHRRGVPLRRRGRRAGRRPRLEARARLPLRPRLGPLAPQGRRRRAAAAPLAAALRGRRPDLPAARRPCARVRSRDLPRARRTTSWRRCRTPATTCMRAP